MQEDGSNFSTVLHSEMASVEAIAIDQITNLMYYFDNTTRQIIMATLNGLHQKIIVKNLKRVVDLALYEEMGYLFYSDYVNYTIGRINTDGTNLRTYYWGLWRATGLAVDKTERRLYFCDNLLKIIQSTNLNFKDDRIHIHMTKYNAFNKAFELKSSFNNFVYAPRSLAILHSKLFWADMNHEAIFQCDKRFGVSIEYVVGGLKKPRDIHVFIDKTQPGKP